MEDVIPSRHPAPGYGPGATRAETACRFQALLPRVYANDGMSRLTGSVANRALAEPDEWGPSGTRSVPDAKTHRCRQNVFECSTPRLRWRSLQRFLGMR